MSKEMKKGTNPVYSHNPYQSTKFPLLVLDVQRNVCKPCNEGFRVLHWHEELQFVYILKGKVHFKIWEEEMNLKAGDCMFINSNAMHCITEKEDCRYHSFLIPHKMLGFLEGSVMEEEVEKIAGNPMTAYFVINPANPEHAGVLKKLEQLDTRYFLEKETPHWEYRVCISLAELWLAFLELAEKGRTQGIPKKSHQRIQMLISFIHQNYAQPISLEEIADAANISRTECLRCFKKYTGYSPYQYLIQYRLQAGTHLLASSGMSVTEIAFGTGFRSVSSYIGYFKKNYGMTPLQYKNKYCKG